MFNADKYITWSLSITAVIIIHRQRSATENAENAVVDNPTFVWRPFPRNPGEYPHIPYISRNRNHTIGLHFAADNMNLYSFKFLWWAP